MRPLHILMIKLTQIAQDKLAEYLTKTPDCSCVRVGVKGGGCSGFSYDLSLGPAEGWPANYEQEWELFEFPGVKVFIDKMSLMYLDGVELDYQETLTSQGFVFRNPNVKTTCGCGSSFSV